MVVHDLKTWPEVFAALWNGDKTAEFRKDDRDFQVGDQLRLNEFDPQSNTYTTRCVIATVSHIVWGGQFGIPEGYVMMSLMNPIKWGPDPDGFLLRDLLAEDVTD